MLQLLELQVGRDDNKIGFPSVQTCLAVVLQTTGELFGWHSLNTGENSMKNNAAKMLTFIQSTPTNNAIHLYAATNREVHHRDWRTELTAIADGLSYHGPATSIDLNVNTEGVYVEFQRGAGSRTCSISYKRNAKIDYDTFATRLFPDTVRHRQLGGPNDYKHIAAGEDGKSKIYTVVRTNATSSKGHLNSVSRSQTDTITIP